MILSVYFYIGTFHIAYNLVFANLVLICIPVIVAFLFAQKHIVKGLTAGAVKG
jgi:raffinose/stachyose/melibiose transport system permease protein